MRRVTRKNYRKDKYYRRVVRAVTAALKESKVVAPIAVFQNMGLLSPQDVQEWRRGRIPYLEKAIRCNLAKASRILRILNLHAQACSLAPSWTGYCRKTRGGKIRLRFSKYSDPNLEEAYSRHFLHPSLREKAKPKPAEQRGNPALREKRSTLTGADTRRASVP